MLSEKDVYNSRGFPTVFHGVILFDESSPTRSTHVSNTIGSISRRFCVNLPQSENHMILKTVEIVHMIYKSLFRILGQPNLVTQCRLFSIQSTCFHNLHQNPSESSRISRKRGIDSFANEGEFRVVIDVETQLHPYFRLLIKNDK